jgi:AmmeMemoRadiSam system protein A
MPLPYPDPLSGDVRRSLLLIAHQAIHSAVVLCEFPSLPPAAPGPLARPAGAFVTLHLHGQLRGCIGRVDAVDPLATVVSSCAISAALHDSRFKPVAADEVADLEIEISVLSEMLPIAANDLVPGVHGLVVSRGTHRGLLLPQVATERNWDSQRFLEETCAKAGLPCDSYTLPGTHIEAFTAEVFSDSDLAPREAPPNS